MKILSAWDKYDDRNSNIIFDFANEYCKFISCCKTEREFVSKIYSIAQKDGFVDIKNLMDRKTKLCAGERVIINNNGKGLLLAVIGKTDLKQGMNILGAHIDSPRIDLKQVPLYEDSGMALLDTHYYGGIKKYQWVALPLALHGMVCKKDGTNINVNIGEDINDPVFGISDLLVHLSNEQMKKPAYDVIEGEKLDILVGNIPLKKVIDSKENERVKYNILEILQKKYAIEEADFVSAEIEVVPAGKARNYGLDESMIMGYGHDDRSCAFVAYKALSKIEKPLKTSICILVDKEEIGNIGSSSIESRFFENSIAELMNLINEYDELNLRRALSNSNALSADVVAAFDTNYPSVMDKRNAALFGKGLVFCKYTGSRGKSGANDAHAEYIAKLRNVMEKNNISYQTAEIGKVDQGGGGTIAYNFAKYGMNVIDCGISVLNMHAPWEIISKVDLYELLQGYTSFLKEEKF